ncbi:MAG: hypothetical protein ABIG10_01875 [bacterium]
MYNKKKEEIVEEVNLIILSNLFGQSNKECLERNLKLEKILKQTEECTFAGSPTVIAGEVPECYQDDSGLNPFLGSGHIIDKFKKAQYIGLNKKTNKHIFVSIMSGRVYFVELMVELIVKTAAEIAKAKNINAFKIFDANAA